MLQTVLVLAFGVLHPNPALARPPVSSPATTAVLASEAALNDIGAKILALEPKTGTGLARLTADQLLSLSRYSHEHGRCGGFEALNGPFDESPAFIKENLFSKLANLWARERTEAKFQPAVQPRPEIAAALREVSEQRLKDDVVFLSGFHSRDHRESGANIPIEALRARIEGIMKSARFPYKIDLIDHSSTNQKSIRLRIPGRLRPSEIVVFGAHADSINWEWSDYAPGADDDASGSANLLETLRVIATKNQPERTLEFFWYAGEEGGLLGSSEIASEYSQARKDVVAVLQLDMTLFPGTGPLVIGQMTDFTSSWLRNYFSAINSLYIGAKVIESACGYGCSDHVSWYRQGYSAIIPSEAVMEEINHNLHTVRDVIDAKSDFHHAAAFTKIAVVFAMDLANSNLRAP